jgi:hypothetical protein
MLKIANHHQPRPPCPTLACLQQRLPPSQYVETLYNPQVSHQEQVRSQVQQGKIGETHSSEGEDEHQLVQSVHESQVE